MRTVPAAAIAFVVTLFAAPPLLSVLRRAQVFDWPSYRSSHQRATPRGGGVAPAIGCTVAALASADLPGGDQAALLVASVGMALLGLGDDLHPLGVTPRLVGQAAVAGGAVFWLGRSMGGAWAEVLAAVAITLWLAGYVNAFNFMDGINGLAAAQVVVAGVAWWVIGSQEHAPGLAAAGLIVAAAGAAFAPFNAPRARMFLGDVGSYFLGAWLAAAAVLGLRAGIPPEAVLAPLAVYLADTGVTLLRRVGRHEPWSQPHREHTYQRLVQAGWSHGRTTLSLGAAMAATSALGALSLTGSPLLRAAGDALLLLVLVGYLLAPSWWHPPAAGEAPSSQAGRKP